ncbi:MAG: 30S ribosomal protein S20 [Puniceicoccales bacterium]|jgi:small subunit ribosomal protein S20|nr:30S ribosomal protein S20 [Puniceicoccales bacterium]
MANLQSSKKNVRRTVSRTLRNRAVKSKLKTLAGRVAQLRGTVDARRAAIAYISALDKAAKGGVIHSNRANRGKSALTRVILSAAS